MLMWRRKVVMVRLLLVMLLITLTNGNQGEEGEGQKLPRPSVVRGEILTTPKSISSLRKLLYYESRMPSDIQRNRG